MCLVTPVCAVLFDTPGELGKITVIRGFRGNVELRLFCEEKMIDLFTYPQVKL